VWFYLLLAAFLILTFFLIYKWRVSAIEQKNAELLKVNTELDRFVYSASHDLRAPLTSILGLVKLTRLDDDPQNRIQYLDMVEKSIHKLDGFIHDIINYSRNARTEIESRRVEFEPLINGILESLKYQAKNAMIRKDIQIHGEGDFFTDVKRLEIVLFNLISNAIKYHDTEQPDPYIKIAVNFSAHHAAIEVIDNGRGIDKDHLDNIFKMFYRADETSTGSGLGLFIARETIEKIRGTLTVKSVAGKGSAFRIQIPALNS
jgi:signal transduction histidine kinase